LKLNSWIKINILMDRVRDLIEKHETIMRYLFAGSMAFVIEYCSFLIFYSLDGREVIPANIISFSLGLITSFTMQRYWTFMHPTRKYTKRVSYQFILYAVLAIINLFISTLLIKVLQKMGIDPRFGKIIAMCLIIFWNYYILNKSIFLKSYN